MTAAIRRGPSAASSVRIAARAGLVARGVVYLVVAALAATIARRGDSEQSADSSGALAALGERSYGKLLLWALVLGLACYAAWRASQAITGRTSSGGEASGWSRAASVLRALIYLSLALAAVRVATGGGSKSGADQQQSRTAEVLEWPAGKWIVAALGLALVLAGLYEAYIGVAGTFMEKLQDGRLGEVGHGLVRVAGGAGHVGRGAAYALVGIFVVVSALEHDPSKSRGLDGALAELSGRPYGQLLLILLAVGLLAFGLYSIAEARWRRVRA